MDISVIVLRGTDGHYACYPAEDLSRFRLAGYGHSLEEAQADFLQSYQQAQELEALNQNDLPQYRFTFLPVEQLDSPAPITDMDHRLRDIRLSISWGDLANRYFKKRSTYLHHKFTVRPLDGESTRGFSPQDTEQLRRALFDLSERIRRTAESL